MGALELMEDEGSGGGNKLGKGWRWQIEKERKKERERLETGDIKGNKETVALDSTGVKD